MGKYDPLKAALKADGRKVVSLTFAEVESIIGTILPATARKRRQWWENEVDGSHVQAHAWMAAGYEVQTVNQSRGVVTFVHRAKSAS